MRRFENAPEDVLHLIFKESSRNDLVRLSMVNKRFKVLIEPQIYHTIDWTWEEHSIPPITQLLRSILERSELARYIQHVKLTGETFHLPPFRMKLPPRIPVPAAERQGFTKIVKQSNVSNYKVWIESLGDNSHSPLATMDAVLAILLSQLPNLTTLYLGPNFTKETTILGGMFKHTLCNEKSTPFSDFKLLKEVHFEPWIDVERRWGINGNDKKPNNTLCPLTFFYAPAIEHITATIEEPKIFEWPGSPPTPSKLDSLDITLLREGTLGNILSRCNNLHTLAYNFYADKAGERYFSLSPVLSSKGLVNSLRSVQSTIKSLALTCYVTEHDWDGHETEPEGIDSPITVFREFPVLENLEVPYVFLLGNGQNGEMGLGSALPKGLKTLTLTDACVPDWVDEWDGWDGKVVGVIGSWLDRWRESTLLLERINIIDTLMDDYEVSLQEQFKNISLGAGVSIVVSQVEDKRGRNWPRVFERCSED